MQLIVGLGNPGREHEATRHNAGFWWLDNLAESLGAALKLEPRFHGRLARLSTSAGQCWLLQPQTYMNRSGQSVAALAGFYKIPVEQMLVVHDELDLPVGAARLKKGGGVAGHNGLKDIAARLGSEFWRLRLGIGHPGERALVTNYVLHPPREEEAGLISQAVERSLEVWPLIAAGEMERAMHKLHTKEGDA